MINEHPIREVILDIIREKIENHPRSQQKEIGPSEIGHPCTRHLAYKLAGTPPIPRLRDKWRSTVGVFVHKGLGDWFEEVDDVAYSLLNHHLWLVENRVDVGTIYGPNGYDIYGGCDLYSARFEMVIDWKIVGPTTMKTMKSKKDPGPQYRIQAHTYGVGWKNEGKPVKDIGVFFLPSAGALEDGILWHEPFDASVAADAIDRINTIQRLVDVAGPAAPMLVPATEHYCEDRCEWYKYKSQDLTVGCPGVNVKEHKAFKLAAKE